MLVRATGESPRFLGLPDHLIWEILLWSRPDDENQSIWSWLCRVGGTCRVFRRLVRMDRPRATPRSLLPRVFELVPNYNYLNEGPPQDMPPRAPVLLKVILMETIRNSNWMGSNITFFRAELGMAMKDRNGRYSPRIAEALKMLLTTPCMPNLQHVNLYLPGQFDIGGYDYTYSHVDDEFLRGIAREHGGLVTLKLPSICGTNVTSDSFTALAESMPHLEELSIGINWDRQSLPSSSIPVSSLVCHLNEGLTSLSLRFGGLLSQYPSDASFECLQRYLPNLESLTIVSHKITTLRVSNIIRSKRNLSYLSLETHSRWDLNDESVIDAIIEMKLPLETFRVFGCRWINDDSIMRLLRGQVADAGQVTLMNLDICGTRVNPDGLRTFLIEWRESNPVRPLTVEVPTGYDYVEQRNPWQSLVHEFPDVEFTPWRGLL